MLQMCIVRRGVDRGRRVGLNRRREGGKRLNFNLKPNFYVPKFIFE